MMFTGSGEFTRRAFTNNKMDLIQAEGIIDLIHAETEQQHKQALSYFDGKTHQIYQTWTKQLTQYVAHLEAIIDFSEDENLTSDIQSATVKQIEVLKNNIFSHLNDNRKGELIRSGIQLAIVGPPNAGKSSLLNFLANRDAAIVSPFVGTTRDIIEISLDIAGYPVIISDTAGLNEESDDPIEQEGILRARKRFLEAHIKIAMFDANTYPNNTKLTDEIIKLADEHNEKVIKIYNKSDISQLDSNTSGLLISCKTGIGLPEFMNVIEQEIKELFLSNANKVTVVTRERHRQHLQDVVVNLDLALKTTSIELCTERLRTSLHSIGKITGRVDTEQILEVIFRDFCTGK
eukprot:TRINITY_DN6158_c0_g1_i2.p1 TRINITY_DN6158_c0_g1~~TRINITY_DN6158_c0_g1_i2.p1  ORF type:complete len:347 (+),score=67.54 TRINITY_DN6158_c0_g1_i2:499-1539(+)